MAHAHSFSFCLTLSTHSHSLPLTWFCLSVCLLSLSSLLLSHAARASSCHSLPLLAFSFSVCTHVLFAAWRNNMTSYLICPTCAGKEEAATFTTRTARRMLHAAACAGCTHALVAGGAAAASLYPLASHRLGQHIAATPLLVAATSSQTYLFDHQASRCSSFLIRRHAWLHRHSRSLAPHAHATLTLCCHLSLNTPASATHSSPASSLAPPLLLP